MKLKHSKCFIFSSEKSAIKQIVNEFSFGHLINSLFHLQVHVPLLTSSICPSEGLRTALVKMIDKDVALAGLSALCNANVTSIQKLRAQGGAASAGTVGGPAHQQLFVNNFISSVLDADETW